MRATTATLSQVTDLLAAVSAPPLHTATIKHVEVLLLQPQVALVVVITSTGAVTKRAFTFDEPVDAGPRGLGRELPERAARRDGPGRAHAAEQARQPGALATRSASFLEALAPAFSDLAETVEETLYVDGAARLLSRRPVRRPLGDERPDADARAARDAAVGAALGARRAGRLPAHRAREPGARAAARRASSPPTTASATARSAPSA